MDPVSIAASSASLAVFCVKVPMALTIFCLYGLTHSYPGSRCCIHDH